MKSFLILLFAAAVLGRSGFGPTDQEWGYVTVRTGAHMFWWLHYTIADVRDVTERPLVIWLQGGPGASSTGYGNFVELGPLNLDLTVRNTTWVKDVNLLFVDNPVGTGYSYADSTSDLPANNTQIAQDFVELLKSFFKELPQFQKIPLYIFSESYGGKMTAEIGLALHNAITAKEINCTFKGVGLGDSWISPIDSVATWGDYLKNLDMVDSEGYEQIMNAATETQKALDNQDYRGATDGWGNTEFMVMEYSGVDFYNVLTKIYGYSVNRKHKGSLQKHLQDEDQDLDELMNGAVKEALNISQTWGEQSGEVFDALYEDFMKPVTEVVEKLLNNTDVVVAVYNGQLDLIVDTIGTKKWIDNLKWTRSSEWANTTYISFAVDNWVEGYQRIVGNLNYYSVMRSGHMVPLDNPAGMRYILQQVTGNFTV